MKVMTCKQLGGACDKEFKGHSFEEIAEQSRAHGKAMYELGDKKHLIAMEKMQELMEFPEAMQEWMTLKREEFKEQPEQD